ncbi:mechanosensitive ion channel family protein [Candidatus Woesearchaeota archaeon]|nr:mechanosensitive ion channel family protein [Candidatus Woesearchaeota archaeon]
MPLSTTTIKLLISLSIIAVGYLISRAGSSLILSFSRRKEIISVKNLYSIKIFRYLVMIFTILIALIYLQVDLVKDITIVGDFISKTYELLPGILLAILLLILAVAVINLITFGLRRAFAATGITEFMVEQKKEHLLNGIIIFVRISLYLFTGLFLLNLFGVNIKGITSALGWIFYGIMILLFLYLFFGTRTFVENFIAGIYIRTARSFKLGQKVKIDNTEGSIKSISNQAVTVKSDFGYSTSIPNKEFVKKEISFKSIETDLDTLEKIKSYYIEQKPSYCGPASVSMILKILGYNESQSKIGELSETKVGLGTHPETLIKVVQELTKNKVRGAWIDVEHITSLKDEIRLWLNEGALIIVDYQKKMLFPEAKKAHYSVCVAVEGDELVILDPSGKKGGVYLADAEKVYRGMDTYSELINGKRGYIVLAPEGTTAYYRIEEGLIYADPSLYKELSNALKKELYKLTEKSELLESVLPLRVKNFIRKWKEKDRIARLWKPERI